jgi:FkbM family methyltransferase
MTGIARKLIGSCKPEYVFRPRQFWHRLTCRMSGLNPTVVLPWGLPLQVRLDDIIGRQIWTMGVFELAVSEILWRLTDPGDRAIDVGANIAYTASILAVRAGRSGGVVCFEPHPDVSAEASANIARWAEYLVAPVTLARSALSNRQGQLPLYVPRSFEGNRGLSSLSSDGRDAQTIMVKVTTLDDVVGPTATIGVLKVDVEGHEADVLAGGATTLGRRAIRDIVFEDHNSQPSQVSAVLRPYNYTVFRVDYSYLRPIISDPRSAPPPGRSFDTPNYLATLDPVRARERMARRGWRCLTGRRFKLKAAAP